MLIVSYSFKDERRTRCFRIDSNGEPVPTPCRESFQVRKKIVGLGDAVAAVTKAVGIVPCGKCKQRQETLNRVANVGRVKQLWLRCRYILRRGK